MPLRTISNTALQYYLISYDEDGNERHEPDNVLLSNVVRARLADRANPITDVFFISHGWKGDVPAAIEQYDAWVSAMAALENDLTRAREQRRDFLPLIVGLHWPSLPWGDETIPDAAVAGVLGGDSTITDSAQLVNAFAARIANTSTARAALEKLADADARGVEPEADGTLPQDLRFAYQELFAESKLNTLDVAGAPGADQEGFDPELIIRDTQKVLTEASGTSGSTPGVLGFDLGNAFKGLLLSPLRQLSFWKMKERACKFGETGAHALLVTLQSASASGTRFHLMGHSFGCIVVSAAIAGNKGTAPLPYSVSSLILVQGALSIWAYASNIPYLRNTNGYFARLIKNQLVDGPIITTRSKYDLAVGRFYPLGAEINRKIDLPDLPPKYGGIGAFGIQGLGKNAEDLLLGSASYKYGFTAGRIYNLEASAVICNGDGISGAHSDIGHPEVAHAFWEAILAER